MTEAEALAIAMKAIVSAFVTAPPPPPPPAEPARTPKRKRRKKTAPAATFAEIPPMPRFDLPFTAERDDVPDAPRVTVSELEAMMATSAPPEGTYAREDQEDVGGMWLNSQR